jgi:hypothetical protein
MLKEMAVKLFCTFCGVTLLIVNGNGVIFHVLNRLHV